MAEKIQVGLACRDQENVAATFKSHLTQPEGCGYIDTPAPAPPLNSRKEAYRGLWAQANWLKDVACDR